MKAHHFVGEQVVMEAPNNYDHKSMGECIGLPVQRVRMGSGVAYLSMWKPDAIELALLNAGGAVALYVVGCQPPVAVEVAAASTVLVSA